MNPEDVSIDADGKLGLTRPDTAPQPVDARDTAEAPLPDQPDAASVREALIEREEEQEAEQSMLTEARDEASAAEPPEAGARTWDHTRL
jgi:hypothetical protein